MKVLNKALCGILTRRGMHFVEIWQGFMNYYGMKRLETEHKLVDQYSSPDKSYMKFWIKMLIMEINRKELTPILFWEGKEFVLC